MFSVTADVYCGSVCGKTKHPLLAQLPPQMAEEGEEHRLQVSPHVEGVSLSS
jgi:hypothetical protein